MPMPTDRLGRWRFYRARALRRSARLALHTYNRLANLPPNAPPYQTSRSKWVLKDHRLLLPLSAYLVDQRPGPHRGAPLPYLPTVIAAAHYREPPYAALIFPLPFDYHLQQAVCGFQMRSVIHRGTKENRRDARGRLTLGAFTFHRINDFWPHWDPLLREPFIHDDDFMPRTPLALQLSLQR